MEKKQDWTQHAKMSEADFHLTIVFIYKCHVYDITNTSNIYLKNYSEYYLIEPIFTINSIIV